MTLKITGTGCDRPITETELLTSARTLVTDQKREILLEESSTWNIASLQYLNGYLDGLAAIINLLTGKDHEDIRADLDTN